MANTKEYMKEYIKEYHANCPEFYANELKKNNERTAAKYHSNPEYHAKISEYKKSITNKRNWLNLKVLKCRRTNLFLWKLKKMILI